MEAIKREIKFRCWHEGHGRRMPARMAYDDRPGDSLRWLAEGQPVHVMQYTGLKDRNGKEIYEGDVLRYEHDMGSFKYDEVHDVQWTFGLFQFGPFHFRSMPGVFSERQNQVKLEVIGNIYENPELLK